MALALSKLAKRGDLKERVIREPVAATSVGVLSCSSDKPTSPATDPNGIALEASCWTLDATGRPADYGDERLFADPDPVPAVRELRATGKVASTPHTRLV